MQIFIISGMSGAGKSYALQILEGVGFYCIDNLPSQLIEALLKTPQIAGLERLAIGIDIRGGKQSLQAIPNTLACIRQQHPHTQLIYLYAKPEILLKRYNETRRTHPLAKEEKELARAIQLETQLLSTLAEQADWRLDTSSSSIYELACLLRQRLSPQATLNPSLLFQSFGFKHEVPSDSDFVFDMRCLPNPYWVPELRSLTGQDQAIVTWLEQHERVNQMYLAVRDFLSFWMQDLENCQRAYVTVSIGCTGGRHRSVYITERLYRYFKKHLGDSVLLRHREL
ncbi:MAG: RNase adapter RapZ [Proteobacteria bacterium]|nr:MAG: RNase adapter RapZ [Pseudomonadota bacterium]